jgi:hypothetical protein
MQVSVANVDDAIAAAAVRDSGLPETAYTADVRFAGVMEDTVEEDTVEGDFVGVRVCGASASTMSSSTHRVFPD